MSKAENEAVISFNDEEDTAMISTRQRTVKNRLKKLDIVPSHAQADYHCFTVPKNWIKI